MAEPWSWKKFFLGFVDGRTYAKAIVLMFCMAVILGLGYCVLKTIRPSHTTDERIETNAGTINKTDSHDQNEKKTWSLINLFNIG